MKRPYDYSFVQDSDNNTTQSHSFRRRPATLATHPFFDCDDYLLETASRYYYQDLRAAPYLLSNYQDLESDFQSNIWHQSFLATLPTWTNEYRLANPERRLTGLGITFDPSEPLPGSSLCSQVEMSHSDSSVHNPILQPSSRKVQLTDIACHQSAYSECPSADFVAHSPSARSMNYVPCSPTDEFLMLVDSSPLESKMDVDLLADLSTQCSSVIPELSRRLDSPGANHIGIVADVNFRTLAAESFPPVACVNPADLTGPGPALSGLTHEEEHAGPQHPNSSSLATEDRAEFPAEAVSAIVSVLAASAQDRPAPLAPPVKGSPSSGPIICQRQYITHPLTSVQLPAFASRSAGGPVVPDAPISNVASPVRRSPLATIQPLVPVPLVATAMHQLSPVLNAHEGVPLEDLRRRADAFRALNPGFDLDKTFLQAFAGRLSERGELTSDFRCYVKGCSQSNKRRDHILVHVGSHVEHRPFQCDQW